MAAPPDRVPLGDAAGYPAVFAHELRHPSQIVRSLYALFFQLPVVPEVLLSRGDYAMVRRAVQGAIRRPGAFTEADWAAMHRAIAEPGALGAATSYYRAAGRRTARHVLRRRRFDAADDEPAVVPVPTLLLRGRPPSLPARAAHARPRALGAARRRAPLPRRRPLGPLGCRRGCDRSAPRLARGRQGRRLEDVPGQANRDVQPRRDA